MAHLAHMKRRIQSIKTTKKITHAMRLIAMSLYSKLNKEQASLTYYKQTLSNLFKELSMRSTQWENKTFYPKDILDSSPLYIVISATKGFCGGINNFLFHYIEEKLIVEEHQTATFITVGKKATGFIQEKNLGTIIASYHSLNTNSFTSIAKEIAKIITETKSPYSSVTIYSSVFKNFFTQRPTKNRIIPFEEEQCDQSDKKHSTKDIPEYSFDQDIEPIWEQDKIEMTNIIAHKYLHTNLTTVLFQALVAEYASRFVAMDNATTNANNYLDALTLQFNKLRQSLITREVSELSANL